MMLAGTGSRILNLMHINLNSFTRHQVCLLLSYILATSIVISAWAPTCDSEHSWQLHSAASLGHQAVDTMTCYPTQSPIIPSLSQPVLPVSQ